MKHLDLSRGPVEYRLIDGDRALEPLVFLHEGLGCIAMWQRFPDHVAHHTRRTTVIYSRHGHGGSPPTAIPRSACYLHDEADLVLPELLERLCLRRPVLIGHSDGASIALLAASKLPVTGVVAIAPHAFVEPETLQGIGEAALRFEDGKLARKLGMFHEEPDRVFRSWSRIWLSAEFEDWSIEDRLPGITCPVLLVQGTHDQYGTLRQLDTIAANVTGRLHRVELPDCGHSPHLEQPDTLHDVIAGFVRTL